MKKILIITLMLLTITGCKENNINKQNNDYYKEIDFSQLEETGSYVYETENNTMEIIIDNETQTKRMYINNQMYYSSDEYFTSLSDKAYIYGNTFVYGKNNNVLFVYDTELKYPKEYSYFNEYNISVDSYESNENGITLKGNKILEDNSYFIEEEVITIKTCDDYTKHSSDIVEATYYMEFKDNKLNEPVLQSTKTLEDIESFKHLCATNK